MRERRCKAMFYLSIAYLSLLCFLLLHFVTSYMTSQLHYKSAPFIKIRNQNPLLSVDSNCDASFGQTEDEDIQRILGINISSETEVIIQKLGYPPSRITNGKHGLPILEYKDISEVPVVVTAASSNHYREMQALMHNLHRTLKLTYPKMKIILYDIGLEPEEIVITKISCKCEVRKFHFKNYPRHIRDMDTRGWKPVIIQETLNEFGFVMYLDASIRFRRLNMDDIFSLAIANGHLFSQTQINMRNFIPNHTHINTFHYFHEKPCLYHQKMEVQTGFVIITRNNLFSNILMKAWLACCLQEQCVLPKGANAGVCNRTSYMYHKCHRPDQSPFGIIVNLLYHPPASIPYIPYDIYDIRRDHKFDYF